MQRHTLTLLVGALVLIAGGSLVVPQWLAEADTPIVKWTTADEEEVPLDPAQLTAAGDDAIAGGERSAVELAEQPLGADERVDVVLRGRVVDPFQAPVPAATVWLDYGRGGRGGGPGGAGPGGNNRQRRVPEPVQTDAEGRFAFQGQTFRNLRVWLQVAHPRFAPGQFDKDVGPVAVEVDLGDLVLRGGGEARGRVTDLDGNGVANAELRLQPEGRNALRQVRERDRLLPMFTTDQNGFYRRPHLGSGDWTLTAIAKRHTEGRSNTFTVEEAATVEVEDIRLGPGYELSGVVRDARNAPIAKAEVVLQSDGRNRQETGNRPDGGNGRRGGGPAQFFGGGREHRTVTDAEGRFFLEHLPGVSMRLETSADGYLDYRASGIEPTAGQPLFVTMQDGLRIEGAVLDSDQTPVTRFAVRAVWLRGLPSGNTGPADLNQVIAQLRSGAGDAATRRGLEEQAARLGEQFARGARRPGGPGGGPGGGGERGGGERGGGERGGGRGGARDLGRPEVHPGGTFVATGLQEGVYEVHVQSPDHARYRSAELELRVGAPVPQIKAVLDAGVYAAGVVLDVAGAPIRGARVELRQPSAFEGRGRNRGGANGAPGEGFDANALMREFTRAAGGGNVTLEATTDAEGVFVVKHAAPGTYRLHAEARGHANASTDPFELTADRSGFELRLQSLGTLAGTVRNLLPAEVGDARVGVVAVGGSGGMREMFARGGRGGGGGGGGPFQNVAVDAQGKYRIEGLAPGEYAVRCWVGEPMDLFRELGPTLRDGSLPADVVIKASETTQFDCAVTRLPVGTLRGTLTINGKPGSGSQVELARVNTDGSAGNGGNGGGGGRGRGGAGGPFGGLQTHTSGVGSDGRFALEKVPAGSYTLRVVTNGRGTTLLEEPFEMVDGAATERMLVFTTHALQGTVTRDDGGDVAELDGRVSLLPGVTALPENPMQWSRENGGSETRLQDGKFEFRGLKPGGYLLVLNVRGRERTSQPIVVQGDQVLTFVAGKVAAANPSTGPQNPNAPGTPAPGAPRRGQPRTGR